MSKKSRSRNRETMMLLEDLLFDDGFIPGLRPRDHRAPSATDAARAVTVGDETTDLAEPDAQRLVTRVLSRRERSSFVKESDEVASEEATSEETVSAEPEPSAPAPPALSPNTRRLEHASRAVDALETANSYQSELKTVVQVMIGYMRREHCAPGEEAAFDRWWAVLETYRRVLTSPEMAVPGARHVLLRLLALEHRQLTERAIEHVLGRRKPTAARRRKKKRRRKKRHRRRKKIPKSNIPVSSFFRS